MAGKVANIVLGILLVIGAESRELRAQDTKENAEFKLAVNLYNSGMYDLAVDQLQNFINAYPGTANSIEAKFYLGLTQAKLRRYEDARITFQNFALTYTDHPKAPEAWMRVGDAYAALKNDREAASAYERVKIFHPKSPLAAEALLKAAQFYRAAGAKENARKSLRTIMQDYPTSSSVQPARLLMGEMFLEEGREELAQNEFSRVMESSTEPPLKARATLLMARLYSSSGRMEEAESLLKRITTTHKGTPSDTEAMLELGVLLKQSGKYTEAIEHLKKVVADSPLESKLREQATVEIGNCFAAKNDYANAVKQYDQFLSSFAKSEMMGDVLFNAGWTAFQAKQYQSALSYFQKIIPSTTPRVSSYKRKTLAYAAEAAIELKDYAKTVQWYTAFLDAYPADPFLADVVMRIGNVYENHLKDYRRAVNYYEDISVKYAQSHFVDDALLAMGRCRELLGEFEHALLTYQELIEQYPSSEHTPVAQQRIEFLRNHKLKDRDGGLEKLALLMGEQIGGTSKAELAFNLGNIYARDLKNYRSAAQQYRIAIDSGLSNEQHGEALFRLARAYHLLSDLEPDAVSQAITYYDVLVQKFPSNKWSDEASWYALQLKCRGKSPEGIIALTKEQLSKRPESLRRHEILMMLGNAQRSDKPNEALATFSTVVKEYIVATGIETAWLQLGNLFVQLGNPDSAAKAYTHITTKFPRGTHTADALWLLANMRMDQQKPNDAIPLFQRLRSDHFYTSYAQRAESALGEAYAESGRFDDAIAVFTSIADREESIPFPHETNHQIIFKLATAYNRKGDKQKAFELYRTFLQHDRRSPLAAEAFFALGVIARDWGKTESASAHFKQAAAISGETGANRDVAELLFQTEQYADAEKQFSQLARAAKNEGEKLYFELRVIICKLRRNDLKNAEPLVKEFAKTYKKNTELLAELEYEKGLCYFRTQDYPNARKAFSTVADDFDKTKFGAWGEFYLGKILEVTNKTPDAVKKYESVAKRYPKSNIIPRVYLSLGNISYNAEKYRDAIVHYQKILESSDTTDEILPFAMNNLIDAYEAIQLYDAALQTTRNFIERYPNDPGIMDKRINVGVLYIRLGYHDQAIVHLQKLLDEAGSDLEAEIRYAIGEAYYYKADYQQAILEFLKVPYLVTRRGKIDWTATSFYMAGQAYEKMSKFDQAITMYQQIIDRPGIDGTFKAAAKKEIDRVKTITNSK
jgi:TolA-binding protein